MTIFTPFSVRYSANANGDIVYVANTLLTAPGTGSAATKARNGTSGDLNDDFNMSYVDVDSDASTFNSSRADLALPAGGSILFAGLYWGADSTSSSRNQVKFQAPGSSTYSTVTGSVVGSTSAGDYQGFADVTTLVKAAGAGTYGVANVQAQTGSNEYAGWSLVIVYADPSSPPRNLTVFDGYVRVDSATPNVSIPISGFRAPQAGPVKASVGIVAYEGDLGLTGDSVTFNGTTLTDASNPSKNFFNGTISNRGTTVATRAPNYVNQLGIDADIVATSGLIAPNATSATINLKTDSDQYFPGVVTTAIDLYAPTVSIAKSVADLNGGGVRPEDVLEYTSVVQVTAGEAASQFVFFDPIPENATFQPGSISVGSAAMSDAAGDDLAYYDSDNGRVVYRLGTGATSSAGGTVAVGQSVTVRYRVVVNATALDGSTLVGQGSATFAGAVTGAALSATSNAVRSTVTRVEDLALTQTVNNVAPEVGDDVVITLSVANTQDFPVSGVVITDLLPAGLAYVSAVAPPGTTYNPATGVWSVGMVDGTAPVVLRITARVVATSAVTNSAQITAADKPDPNSANDAASVTISPRTADLSVVKAVGQARPNVGDRITFTTTLTNAGPSTVSNVQVEDKLPAGFTFVSAAGASYNSETGVWKIDSLAPGAVVLTLTVDVTGPASSTATAKILANATYDPNAGNNASSTTVTPRQANVSVVKTVDETRPNVGRDVVLTTRVRNTGPDAATNITIASPIGTGLTIKGVQAASGTTYNQATGTWTVTTLGPNEELTLTVTATVGGPDAVVSTATLTRLDQYDAGGADFASVTVSPRSADLAPTIAISKPAPVAGESVTLTITVRNSGPDGATSVRLLSALPGAFQFVSASPEVGSYDPATGVWTVGTVASGSSRTLTITANVLAAGAATQSVSVLAADQHDPNAGNNSASVSVSTSIVDLALASAFSKSQPKIGETIDYVVTLTSPGTADATGVSVSALLPAGLAFVSSDAGAAYDAETGVWSVGAVAKGSTAMLKIRATVGAAAVVKQTAVASIAASSPADAVAGNNAASASLTAQSADLILSASVDKPVPKMRETMTFRVTVANQGPNDATDVVVTHEIPPNMLFIGLTAPEGTSYEQATGRWVLGSVVLKPGESRTLVLQAQALDADPRTISASITGSGQFDPSAENNSASVTFDAQQSELALGATSDVERPRPGQVVTFTLTATNSGPDAATGVRVQTALPPGLTLQDSTASGAATFGSDGVWNVGSLAVGQTATLTIRAVATAPAAGDFTAAFLPQEQHDSSPLDDSIAIAVAPLVADLSVAASVDQARPNVEDVVTMTITVSNGGPDGVANVVASAPVPVGYTFDSADAPDGTTYDPIAGLWTIPGLAPGDSLSLPLRLRVQDPTVARFYTAVTAADAFDLDTADLTASVDVAPLRADLAVAASADVLNPNAHQLVTFTITLSDLGPDGATGAVVSIPIPAGYTFDSASATSGSYDPIAGLWTLDGPVAFGSPAVLTLRTTTDALALPPLTVTIAQADQYDGATANNSASVFVKPKKVDLVVGKVVSSPTPQVGDTITYTLLVRNGGDDDATGVVVRDDLPAGMTFVSAVGDGAYDPIAGLWSVGAVAKDGEAILTISVLVSTGSPTVNLATIEEVDQFDVHSVNDEAETTVDPQQADLLITATVDDPDPLVGQAAVFTITVRNLGKDPAGVVAVDLTIPDGLEFDSSSTAFGSYDIGTGRWTVGELFSGDSATLTFRARVLNVQAQTLSAAIATTDQFDPNVNDDIARATVQAQTSDLRMKFSVDESRPIKGQLVTVDLDVTNQGPDDATGATVTLTIPAGFELVSISEGAAYDATTGVWTIGGIDAGSTTRLTFTLRALTGDPLTIEATSSADQFDPTPEDRSIAVTVTPQRSDLTVAASVDVPRPDARQVVAITITLANTGPDDAEGVVVSALLPAGLEYVSSLPGPGSYDPITGLWTLTHVPTGSSATLTIWARAISPAPSTLTASVTAVDQFDDDLDDLAASVVVTPKSADVLVTTAVDNPTPNVGDVVTVTVTVRNLGPDAATGVSIENLFPDGLSILESQADQGEFSTLTGLWTVGEILPDGSVTLVYRYRVTGPGTMTTTTSLGAVDQFDPTPETPTTTTIAPLSADVGLTITADEARPNVGERVEFTIVVSNVGPDSATGLRVTTTLPAGLEFESAVGAGYDPATGEWTVGELGPDGTRTLRIVAIVTAPGDQILTAGVSKVDEYDPTEGDRLASATVTSQQVRLSLAQTVDVAAPLKGQVVEYTVVLTNAGPDAATNAHIRQALPEGMEYVSTEAEGATYDPATGVWTVPNLPEGGRIVLKLRGRVVAPGAKTTTAEFLSADQYDPESVAPATVSIAPTGVAVAVSVVVDHPRPDAGQLVLVTVTATNAGPDAATGLAFATSLPVGLTFVSSEAGQGAYDRSTGGWAAGSIAPGGSAVLRIWARATAATDGSVAARLTAVDQFDATADDDAVSYVVSPRRADLSVRVEGMPGSVDVGGRYDVRVIVTNNGPDGATGARIPIAVPPGFRLVSSVAGRGSYDPASGLWTVGDVPAGGSWTLNLTLEAVAPGAFDIVAGPAASQQFDPSPGDDAASAAGLARQPTIPVEPPAPNEPVAPTEPTPPTTPTGPIATTGRVTGVVYLDRRRNGVYDVGRDLGVASVQVILTGVDEGGRSVRLATITAADGSFAFDGVRPGTYSLVEQAPSRYFRSARTAVGTLGGVAVRGGAQVDRIVVSPGSTGSGYAFGTVPYVNCRMNLLMGRGEARAVPRGPILSRFFPAGRPDRAGVFRMGRSR